MSVLTIFIQKAIVQGICILYGALGEIMTEKSGNLNLGIPGIMYMGGIAGLMGAFLYEKDNPNPNAFIGVLISFVCAFACAMIGGLIYSILTITLRVNQNVTGLALTIFGTGFGNFFGGSISKLAGGVGQISVKVTGSAYTAKIPGLSKIPVIGVTICGRFCSDEGVVVGYDNRIRTKYTAKWGVQIAGMIFQTRSRALSFFR